MGLNKIRLLSQVVTPYAPHLVDLASLLGIPLGGIYYPDAEYLYLDYAFLDRPTVKLYSSIQSLKLRVFISEESFAGLLMDTAANIPISDTLHKLDIIFV